MPARLEGRNGEIWRLFCRGMTQDALAEKYGISQQRVSQIINDIREKMPVEERNNLVQQETDLLRQLRADVLELFDADPMPLVSNGRVIEGVEDHSGRLAAVQRAESLTARLHRILGLDSPQKLDLTLAGEEEAARKAAADALSHLAGEGEA